ncbi:Low affinity Fe/Cu permease [Kaistella treverensis]|uniref:Low affinity Fe/Cu permease n=2 Tax=Kaistella treverensis TaxID=631455 RepID=A0A1I3MS77_9FLAO|nr:Low affinity Fe/Cu permease [Kaistella treverensis]
MCTIIASDSAFITKFTIMASLAEKDKEPRENFFDNFANWASKFTGSPGAFIGAAVIVLLWAISGPIFKFSETWQLVINTGTTIITFLMVFLIQKSQNKDSKAIQIKLNELIAAHEKASNRIVDIEDLTEKELDRLHRYYEKLSELAQEDNDLHISHSIDAAEDNQEVKMRNLHIEAEIEKEDK